MNNVNKLLLSSYLIKKATQLTNTKLQSQYPAINQNKLRQYVTQGPRPVAAQVPKAIPVEAPVPKAIPVEPPVPKAIPVQAAPMPQFANMKYYRPILDVVGKGEASTHGYNEMGGSTKNHYLIYKTLNQLGQLQGSRKSTFGTAAGRYQFLDKTLENLIKKYNYDPNKVKFDEATQDEMALRLMQQRGLDSFMSGKISADQFRKNLAKEWAAIPYENEKSYYHSKTNRARVTTKEVMDALNKARELYNESLMR